MILKKLTILNYRNIAEAELDFSPKINCFVGRNGEGKTNILDSIYFLSFTKSMANSVDSMNVRHGEEMMMVQGIYDLNDTEEEISIGMKIHQKKHVKRNKKEYKRIVEHIGLLPLIIASPNDYTLISGGSEERRRLMDIVISQYDSEYMTSLMAYNKALQQRNAMLKAEEEPNVDIISLYEEMMASYGEKIYEKRKAFIDEFIPVFQVYYESISGGKEKVSLTYTSHCQRGALLDVIQRDRAKDRIMGYSLHGIHKDELEMTLDGYPIKREGSQGQNKTYMISLKLAQFDFLKRTGSKTTPLLLLDDIFDKLDARRVEEIVNLVSSNSFGQIFITDTNRENLDKILERTQGDYKIFNVEKGCVVSF
ncbi:MAG: DNA replication and repair protein RecF [Prevotellaceae bacterium]|nr:DNA replication and repair protein RecF [Candidatus Minthosoma equi]